MHPSFYGVIVWALKMELNLKTKQEKMEWNETWVRWWQILYENRNATELVCSQLISIRMQSALKSRQCDVYFNPNVRRI